MASEEVEDVEELRDVEGVGAFTSDVKQIDVFRLFLDEVSKSADLRLGVELCSSPF